jgi:hypothetical protein
VTLSRLWAFLAIALPTLAALIAPLQTVDLTYHLRAGAEILDSRAIPSADTWTFTAARLPWTDQQWGAQAILTAVYQAGGWTGLVLLRAALVALIFGCLFAIGRGRGLSERVAAWLTLAAFIVSAAALALRPQLFGMALFAVVLWHVASRRMHPERLWPVPILVLLWANMHGSFFLGPLVLGLAWLEDIHDRVARPHRLLVVAALTVAAACITPFGPAVWAYAVGLSTNPEVTRRITEWQRTSPTDAAGVVFYASVVAVSILLVRRGRSTPWPALVWLAIFFVTGAYAARGIAWWSLAAVVPVAALLAPRQPDGSGTAAAAAAVRPTPPLMRRLNAVVAGLIVLAGVAVLPVWRPNDQGTLAPQGVLANAPPGITAALRDLARPGDRLFNPQPWGSWFEFALPDLPVAIDSRIELFPPETWDAFDAITNGTTDPTNKFTGWGVTIVVATPDERLLVDRLLLQGWRVAHEDVDGRILVRPDR